MVVTLSQWFVVCTLIVPYVYEYTQYYWVTVFFFSLSLCFLYLLAIFPFFFHSLTQSSPIWILTRYWAAQFWACDLCLFFKEGSYALVENPFSSYFPPLLHATTPSSPLWSCACYHLLSRYYVPGPVLSLHIYYYINSHNHPMKENQLPYISSMRKTEPSVTCLKV